MHSQMRSERCDDQAPGNWRDSPKPINKKNKRDNNRDSGDRLRDLLEWSKELTDNLEDTEVPAPAHISHDPDSEWHTKVASKKHFFFLTSCKIEIARSASEPRLQGLLAEDEQEIPYIEQKSLVIVPQLITKSQRIM